MQAVVARFVEDDFELKYSLDGVKPPSQEVANQNRAYVKDYGEKLALLNDQVWESSRAQWMGEHWDFILDLCTQLEGVSDLALHGKAHPSPSSVKLEVGLIYVP